MLVHANKIGINPVWALFRTNEKAGQPHKVEVVVDIRPKIMPLPGRLNEVLGRDEEVNRTLNIAVRDRVEILRISAEEPWLEVLGVETTPEGCAAEIRFSARLLKPGEYTGSVEVESSLETVPLLSIPVRLQVVPDILVHPNALFVSYTGSLQGEGAVESFVRIAYKGQRPGELDVMVYPDEVWSYRVQPMEDHTRVYLILSETSSPGLIKGRLAIKCASLDEEIVIPLTGYRPL
jgi:hypothetical protein